MSSFRVCPTNTVGTTRMEFDYFHLESGEKFEEYYNFVRQVALEDFELCEKAQENLQKGIYAEGILNPVKETGVACMFHAKGMCSADQLTSFADYQKRVLELVLEQYEKDKPKPAVPRLLENMPIPDDQVITVA